MKFAKRFWWLFLIAAAGAWWFYGKLGWDRIHLPAVGDFSIGWWYIPLFMFVIFATAISSNETDGLDGLNGGVLLMAFSSFAIIAFVQNKVDLASFCAAVAGALLSFFWFHIYPARFFMGDTGAMSSGTTLGVVAMLTNSAIVLFIIVFLYVLESGSAALQLLSKRVIHRKIFLAAPIHHHFEAKGWPEPKIVMRAWIFTAVTALAGVIIGNYSGWENDTDFNLGDYNEAMPEDSKFPLYEELEVIRQYRDGNDIILMDDMRVHDPKRLIAHLPNISFIDLDQGYGVSGNVRLRDLSSVQDRHEASQEGQVCL